MCARRALVPRFPYAVVFVVHEQDVVALAHPRRRPREPDGAREIATRDIIHGMTRPRFAAAIRLPEDEKLELLSELWDALDHSATVPNWHKEELDRRLSSADAESLTSWSEAKARILGSK